MFTVEKAIKLLELCEVEYPSLRDEEIEIKIGNEFSASINLLHNEITIINKFDTNNNFVEFLREYLLKNDLDTNNFMFSDFNEVFSFFHEVGHIYYKEIGETSKVQYDLYKSNSYYNYREAFYKYRDIEAEKTSDQFAITMLSNQKVNIWAIMRDISIEDAQEEADFWEFS